MAKGSNFEREICKQLSLWWSGGETDDIFWRTAGSGARAKTRSKVGKKTFGQYGDVQATDPVGQPLIDLCSIEIKRGYSKSTIADLIEKPANAAKQEYEKFFEQAEQDAKNGGMPYWMVIVKRDRKDIMVYIPYELYEYIKQHKGYPHKIANKMNIQYKPHKSKPGKRTHIFSCKLKDFLFKVRPSIFEMMAYDPSCVCCGSYSVKWNGEQWECESCCAYFDYD